MLQRPISYASESMWIPLVVNKPSQYAESKKFGIEHPGKYYFNQDHIQRKTYLDSDGRMHRPTGGRLLAIFCGMVEVDFRGHVLGAEADMSGVGLQPRLNIGMAKRFAQPASLDNRNVTLCNGTIDLAGGEGTGSAIDFVDIWHGKNKLISGRPQNTRGIPLVVKYIKNNYNFRQLKILANKTAITVEGTHTIIRDCVVESADFAAIFIAGDHVLIENCEIRLKKPQSDLRSERAAIVLRDGSHAVIRNNRIRVDYVVGENEKTHCILVRDGATNVLIENNIFINIKGDPVTLTEESQAIVRNNKLKTV